MADQDLYWHRCTPELRAVMESTDLRPYRECAEAPTLTDADDPGSHLHGVPIAVSAELAAHLDRTAPAELWPDWLAGMTPSERVGQILRRHADWCHGEEGACSSGRAVMLLLRMLGEAGQVPAAPTSLTGAQLEVAVPALRRLALPDMLLRGSEGCEAEGAARREYAAGALETIRRLADEHQPEPEAVPEPEPQPAPPLPPGDFGRMELPGFRSHTGWWTPGVLAGQSVMVCADREGNAVAEYIPGPASRFVRLPVPLTVATPEPESLSWADPDDDPDDYATHAIGCHDGECDGECQDGAPF